MRYGCLAINRSIPKGQAGKSEHVLNPGKIPVVQIDRGGQVTYHGPGQLVAYLLINVRRRTLGVRTLVEMIESAMIAALTEFGISADTRPKAPGVYVKDAKIGALGLRIKNGLELSRIKPKCKNGPDTI